MQDESSQDNLNPDAAAMASLNNVDNRFYASGRIFESGNEFISALPNKGVAVRPIGSGKATHNQPRKDLNENTKHGTSVFPFAAYIWEPQNFPSRVTLHWHKEVELVRFSKGKFKISVDMHDLVIENDAFLLLPGNIIHTFELPSHCEESAIVFDPKMLVMTHYDEVQSELFDALLSSNIPIPPIITPEHPAFSRVDKLYRYCARHGATQNASHRLLIKAKLLEIIALYHEYGLLTRKEASKNVLPSKQDKLKDLLNYIDSHFAGPMTIRDASLRLGVTDQYFCRYFKKVTGMSFTEYLGDLRLRRAAKDLELTNRPISDIAFENGFENTGYFFKSFKYKFGVTPLRYRKRCISESMAMDMPEQSSNDEQGPSLRATDIGHTSAAYSSDVNVNQSKPSESHNNEAHTDKGTISFGPNRADLKLGEENELDFEVKKEIGSSPIQVSDIATSLFEDDDDFDLRQFNSKSKAKLNSAAKNSYEQRAARCSSTSSAFDKDPTHVGPTYEEPTNGKSVHEELMATFYSLPQNEVSSASQDVYMTSSTDNSSHKLQSSMDDPSTYELYKDEDEDIEPVDSADVISHLRTNEEIRKALKSHSISHLDALYNEEDLYEDDFDYDLEESNSKEEDSPWSNSYAHSNNNIGNYDLLSKDDEDDAFYPNGFNSKVAPNKRKEDGSYNSDGKEPDDFTSLRRENSTAKKTVFALQGSYNLSDLNKKKGKRLQTKASSNVITPDSPKSSLSSNLYKAQSSESLQDQGAISANKVSSSQGTQASTKSSLDVQGFVQSPVNGMSNLKARRKDKAYELSSNDNNLTKLSQNKDDDYKRSSSARSMQIGFSDEEFWFDDQGNLRSQIKKRISKAIIENEEDLAITSLSKNAAQSRALNQGTSSSASSKNSQILKQKTKGRNFTPQEIRAKIAELERKMNDPFDI